MATGTGKTFTAVKAVGELIQLEKDPFIVVLVPQIDIQYQWVYEFKRQGFDVIFTVGGKPQGITNWEQVLANNILDNLIKKTAVIYVAVYDSFFSKMVQRINRTEKLCLIVDEAHNLTPGQLSKLPDALYRLGLSATPERHDPAEGVSIIQYFIGNGRSTYKYSLKEAIDAGFLSKYEYHPLVVYLNEDEYASYKAYSARIGMLISQPDYDKLELQALLNQRSVIVKKASGKLDLLKTMLISGNYTFKNSVVYCGQGKYGDSDIRLIDLVTQVLYESKYRVSDFTSETEDRRKVLEYFEEGYFDTLAALKCFDEGVDVPKLERIFIMSSDSLIRQTIQRRGRVLRICKESGKTLAYIYDMIVLPPEADCDSGSGISLVSAELKRVKEYASLSVNQAEYASLVTDLEKRFSLQQQLQEPNTGIDEEIL